LVGRSGGNNDSLRRDLIGPFGDGLDGGGWGGITKVKVESSGEDREEQVNFHRYWRFIARLKVIHNSHNCVSRSMFVSVPRVSFSFCPGILGP
jgi:hypothetical protein